LEPVLLKPYEEVNVPSVLFNPRRKRGQSQVARPPPSRRSLPGRVDSAAVQNPSLECRATGTLPNLRQEGSRQRLVVAGLAEFKDGNPLH
jgi:hypothetical protein